MMKCDICDFENAALTRFHHTRLPLSYSTSSSTLNIHVVFSIQHDDNLTGNSTAMLPYHRQSSIMHLHILNVETAK